MATVSVIMPMRNAERYVRDAVLSVLSSSRDDIELIVIDDNSTDRSAAIVEAIEDPRILLVKGPGRGISACLNEGISHAQGAIVMRCDADDLYAAHRIERQVDWLEKHTAYIAVCGQFSMMDQNCRPVADLSDRIGTMPEDVTDELLRGVVRTSLCTFAIRRPFIEKIGGFREFFETAEDIDFQLRLAEVGAVYYLPMDCYRYRLHGTSITHGRSESRKLLFDNLARQLQKERHETGAESTDGKLLKLADLPSERDRHSARQHISDMLIGSAWHHFEHGKTREALAAGARALAYRPWSIGAWRSLAVLALKIVTK